MLSCGSIEGIIHVDQLIWTVFLFIFRCSVDAYVTVSQSAQQMNLAMRALSEIHRTIWFTNLLDGNFLIGK
jgi:hypothetical protein